MEKIDYQNFLDADTTDNHKKHTKARVLDVDSNNSKALVETVDGSLRIKLNNKTGELLSVGDYVTIEYDKMLTKKNAYISFRNGQNVPATKVNIENAIVIQEKVASYLLHEYTLVDYVAGNKVMYGGISNPIIINGFDVHRKDIDYSASYTEINFYHIYQSSMGHYRNNAKVIIEVSSVGSDGSINIYISLVSNSGSALKSKSVLTNDIASVGIGLSYTTIYPPNKDSNYYPNGYAVGDICFKYKDKTTGEIQYEYFNVSGGYYFEFASLSEYNAAVGLTYEPVTLSQVNETITEVQ